MTKNKWTSVSAYQLYEFHTIQRGTNIHPGQTFNLDYSLMQILPLPKDILLQFGLVGYGQWQTSNHPGPGVNPANPPHYSVNPIVGAAKVSIPANKRGIGFMRFKYSPN